MTYRKLLDAKPCKEGRNWLLEQQRAGLTLAEAWAVCSRADWMFWALNVLNIELTQEQGLRLQLLALEMPLGDGRTVLDLIKDERGLTFIDLKRRRLAGEEISEQTWVMTRDAAWAAVRDATRAALWDTAWIAAQAWQADRLREVIGNPF